MSVIYESEDVRITADLRDAPGVVISFSYFYEGEEKPQAFGDGSIQKLGFAGVFVVGRSAHWWQVPDRAQIAAAVRAATQGYARRVAYGTSMGGYGALSLGRAMGCERVVAIAPQTIISGENVPLRVEWAQSIAKRPILTDDLPTDLGDLVPEIVYDPYMPRDAWHVRHLRERHPVIEGPLRHASHKVLITLKQAGILRPVTAAWLGSSVRDPSIMTAYRRHRGRSEQYLHALARDLARTGRVAAAQSCRRKAESLGAEAGRDGERAARRAS